MDKSETVMPANDPPERLDKKEVRTHQRKEKQKVMHSSYGQSLQCEHREGQLGQRFRYQESTDDIRISQLDLDRQLQEMTSSVNSCAFKMGDKAAATAA